MTLAAPGAAPIGLDWTGNPVFTVPTSLLGVPSLSLPLFEDDGLPLGLQLVGFTDRDADVFSAVRSWRCCRLTYGVCHWKFLLE